MKADAWEERRDQVEGSIRVLFDLGHRGSIPEGHICVCRWDGHEYTDLSPEAAQEVLDAEEETRKYEDLLDQEGASD